MWSSKVYNFAEFQTHSPIGEYFTDQNNVNFRPFFHKKRISTGIFSNRSLRSWWNCLKLGTNVQEDRLIKKVSLNFFFAPNVYFTDRKVVNFSIFSL